mgnify:CR=1 FL=1
MDDGQTPKVLKFSFFLMSPGLLPPAQRTECELSIPVSTGVYLYRKAPLCNETQIFLIISAAISFRFDILYDHIWQPSLHPNQILGERRLH